MRFHFIKQVKNFLIFNEKSYNSSTFIVIFRFFVFFDAPYHCVWSSHERGKWFHMTLLWLWPCITYSGVAGEDWHRRSEGVLKVEKSPDETDEKKSFKKVPLDRKASKFAWLMAEEGFFSPKVLVSDARQFHAWLILWNFYFRDLQF